MDSSPYRDALRNLKSFRKNVNHSQSTAKSNRVTDQRVNQQNGHPKVESATGNKGDGKSDFMMTRNENQIYKRYCDMSY